MDDRYDLFERAGAATRRVTTGPSGGNASVDIVCPHFAGYCGGFAFSSADGSSVFFETRERLASEDVHDAIDVYRRAGHETTLLSPARAGEPSRDVTFVDGSEGGATAYLQTEERLTADDTNTRTDGYRVRSTILPPAASPIADVAPPAGAVTERPPAGTETAPEPRKADGLRLLSRPRALRLARGPTRIERRGSGIRLTLPRAGMLDVRIARLRAGRYVPVGRLQLRALRGRQVLRLGSRLPRGGRIRPGRHRLTLVAGSGPPVRLVVQLRRPTGL